MIDVKDHNNASGTAFIDFTKEGHQPNLLGTKFFFHMLSNFLCTCLVLLASVVFLAFGFA